MASLLHPPTLLLFACPAPRCVWGRHRAPDEPHDPRRHVGGAAVRRLVESACAVCVNVKCVCSAVACACSARLVGTAVRARRISCPISSPQHTTGIWPVMHTARGGTVSRARLLTPTAPPLPQHSPRSLPLSARAYLLHCALAPHAWRHVYVQRTHSLCAQHVHCSVARRRGGVPGGGLRPESGRLRRSDSPLLGGSVSGSGVASPLLGRPQPPPAPRPPSSLAPSLPSSRPPSAAGELLGDFALAHDALDEFRRL